MKKLFFTLVAIFATPGFPSAQAITAQWAFDGKWDPVKK